MCTQFLLAVSKNPPNTAQPKPYNISCACHNCGVNTEYFSKSKWKVLGVSDCCKNSADQINGNKTPTRNANVKNGRKPAPNTGCFQNEINGVFIGLIYPLLTK